MMPSPEVLKILCCPETHQGLRIADASTIQKINEQIVTGKLRNRGGQQLNQKLDGGLLREDGKTLYPIRDRLPVLLIDESISVGT